ncbi:MAG: hypothetical protein KC447_04350 [Rhodobacteraceae bacterium]|nr:hypothetical protein [Paracoccaceae bacterium]
MLIPLIVGLLLGSAIAFTLQSTGIAKQRSGLAVTLIIIAAFYPAFAVANGDTYSFIIQTAIMALFVVCACFGFKRSAAIIALGLVVHGMFDVSMLFFKSPAPIWWPTFCAAVDIVLGLWLFRLTRQGFIR